MSEYESATQLRAPQKYAKFPGNSNLVYRDICQVLSERKDQVDWDEYTEDEWRLIGVMAETEGVGPLLYWNFKDGAWPARMPEALQSLLKQSYYNTLAYNTILYKELDRILTALSEAEIPVIVLKGAALAVTVYEDIGLRPMNDIDLIVPQSLVNSAVNSLLKIDYTEVDLIPGLKRKTDTDHEVKLIGGPEYKISIDLHWKWCSEEYHWLFEPQEWYWNSSTYFDTFTVDSIQDKVEKNISIRYPIAINSQSCIQNSEANLRYLSYHLFRHWRFHPRLIWFYDVNLVLGNYSNRFNWNEVFSDGRWKPILSVVLKNTQQYFGNSFPSQVDELVSTNYPEELVLEHLLQLNILKKSTRTEKVLGNLAKISRRSRISVIYAYLFPGPEYMKYRYHLRSYWLLPVFYAYRWINIIYDNIKTIGIVVVRHLYQ